ncbi:MAG: DUF3592 domain-containing protein [Marinibacterium sp.]
MFLFSQPFLYKIHADERREASWRLWLLIWILPAGFALAAIWLVAVAAYGQVATQPATGEVVRVYGWEGGTIFDRGTMNYSPVFRYRWSDGADTEASTGMSRPEWNYAIGSRHDIRYFPARKRDVILPGWHNWLPALIIFGMAAVLAVPALLAALRLRRWQQAGTAG